MADYRDRELHSVNVSVLQPTIVEDGLLVGATIQINLTLEGSDDSGPGVDISIGIPNAGTMTIAQLHQEALKRAHALIQRVAAEKMETLVEVGSAPEEWVMDES